MEVSSLKSKLYQVVLNTIKDQSSIDMKKQLIKEQVDIMKIQRLAEPFKGYKIDLYT